MKVGCFRGIYTKENSMLEYRFYKLNMEVERFLGESYTHDPDVTDAKSSEDTMSDLESRKQDIEDVLIQSGGEDKDIKDSLYRISKKAFDFMKEVRRNYREGGIFQDLYKNLYELSMSRDHSALTSGLKSIVNYINDRLGKFRNSPLFGVSYS